MSNVTEFPSDKSIRGRLDEGIENLSDVYGTLERAYGLIQQLEEKAHLLEIDYNGLLKKYEKIVAGFENIEVKYLEYATNLQFSLESGIMGFKEDTCE